MRLGEPPGCSISAVQAGCQLTGKTATVGLSERALNEISAAPIVISESSTAVLERFSSSADQGSTATSRPKTTGRVRMSGRVRTGFCPAVIKGIGLLRVCHSTTELEDVFRVTLRKSSHASTASLVPE